jgi:hypothetical protein
VKNLGFAAGSGSAGAVGADGTGPRFCGAAGAGPAGSWANAREVVGRREAVRRRRRFFNEFPFVRQKLW